MENRCFSVFTFQPPWPRYSWPRYSWRCVMYMTVILVIIFIFEWQRIERIWSRNTGRTGRIFCPLFIKLHKREFSFLIASYFEYIFLHPPFTSPCCCRGKHWTMDFAWSSFSSLFAFSADRSVEILIFVFPRHQPLRSPPSRFLSSWETWGTKKKKEKKTLLMLDRHFMLKVFSVLLSFPTRNPPRVHLCRAKTFANMRRDFSFPSL